MDQPPTKSHAELLLTAHPDSVHRMQARLGHEIDSVRKNPESAKHFRETAAMTPVARAPGDLPEGGVTDSGLLRALLESSAATGKNEGRAVTKAQIWLLTSVVGVLWLSTMTLGGIVWNDMKTRVEDTEKQLRAVALDVNTLKTKDEAKERRMDRFDEKQDLTLRKLDELKDELRKPK